MNNSDHLYNAFSAVYLDLCAHGICKYDPQILAAMWASFLIDMAHGFPSMFEAMARYDVQARAH